MASYKKISLDSHVIICSNDVPDKTLVEGATLAAYYSKAKDSSKVPVDYTLVKNLKKPNGANPGMVIYHTNYTMYVEPSDVNNLKYRKEIINIEKLLLAINKR